MNSLFPRISAQYGPSAVCADPVTGSSSIPDPGAKNRDTKSNSGLEDRAVTITPRTGTFAQLRVVRRKRAHCLLGVRFHQIVESVLAHELRSAHSQGGQQLGGSLGRYRDLRREIELDPVAAPVGGQQAAARMEPRLPPLRQMAVLPQNVRARHRSVAAEIHLYRGSKPAQRVAIVARHQEGGLR